MGQPTQRATNYTARSNIEPSQIFLTALAQHISHSHSGIDEKRPTESLSVGIDTIFSLPILCGKYCNKRWSGGNTILRNIVGDKGGGGGGVRVPKQGGCLQIIVLILVL